MFNNHGRHRLKFAYQANGPNLGSLTVSAVSVVARRKRDTTENLIWELGQITPQSAWRLVDKTFDQPGKDCKLHSYVNIPDVIPYNQT